MNKWVSDTEIEEAKGQAKYTGYFWIVVVCGHILITLNHAILNFETTVFLINIFFIFIEFILINLSFKFSRFVSVITPIIFLSLLISPIFFITEFSLDFYYSFWKDFIEVHRENHGEDAHDRRMIYFVIIPFLPLIFFYKGIKGSFAYHKYYKLKMTGTTEEE
jgi:hypothetical protein